MDGSVTSTVATVAWWSVLPLVSSRCVSLSLRGRFGGLIPCVGAALQQKES